MTGIEYTERKPGAPLADFVESFWMLSNTSAEEKPVVIVPDGRIDLAFPFEEPYTLRLMGLESEPGHGVLLPGTRMFSVSFKLPAVEYLFGQQFPTLLDAVYSLPPNYLGITIKEFTTFEAFCDKLSEKLTEKLNVEIDPRKRQLFDLIYNSRGAVTIAEVAETIHWSSRQINRYFNDRFGISLKAYCTILRFRASFRQLREGKLFPEEHFSDQAHFIKNVRKFAGVTPKELSKNKNDRFIQLSTLKKK